MDDLIINLSKFFNKKLARNKVTLVNFHRVVETQDPLRGDGVLVDSFYQKMKLLKKHFSVISLDEAIELSVQGNLPPYAVVITIDDGYKDSYTLITPILNDLKLPGTFFITTEGLESGMLWKDRIIESIRHSSSDKIVDYLGYKEISIVNDQEKYATIQIIADKLKYYSIEKRDCLLLELENKIGAYQSTDLFLTQQDIVDMHNLGMGIGAHTHRHPILKQESITIAQSEIAESKRILENIIGSEVGHFAYPNGKINIDFDETHQQILKELGFKSALSTDWGVLSDIDEQRFSIPRFTPWDNSALLFSLRLINNFRVNYND